MARWSASGLREPTSILEAAIQSSSVLVTCRCGRSASFWAPGLWWLFHRKRWDEGLEAALARFRCHACSDHAGAPVRPERLELVQQGPLDVLFPEPNRREWKRALSRVR